MRVTTALPEEVHGFRYVKNHHYIELEDKAGNRVRLNASAILIGVCDACKEKCVALTNMGDMRCTHCGGEVKWAWHRPQLAFIPEKASSFLAFDTDKATESKG